MTSEKKCQLMKVAEHCSCHPSLLLTLHQVKQAPAESSSLKQEQKRLTSLQTYGNRDIHAKRQFSVKPTAAQPQLGKNASQLGSSAAPVWSVTGVCVLTSLCPRRHSCWEQDISQIRRGLPSGRWQAQFKQVWEKSHSQATDPWRGIT